MRLNSGADEVIALDGRGADEEACRVVRLHSRYCFGPACTGALPWLLKQDGTLTLVGLPDKPPCG